MLTQKVLEPCGLSSSANEQRLPSSKPYLEGLKHSPTSREFEVDRHAACSKHSPINVPYRGSGFSILAGSILRLLDGKVRKMMDNARD